MPPIKRYEPVLQYRYIVTLSTNLSTLSPGGEPTLGIFTAKSIDLPKLSFDEVEVDQRAASFKVKGKLRYEDIQMTLYTSPDTFITLWTWVNKHQNTSSGKESDKDTYQESFVQIDILKPSGDVFQTWKLNGAFIGDIDFGEMDWESSEVNLVTLTIRYDYATISGVDATISGGE